MRVRTYGFPGCFTRPPGTSTRHHPHEPTTSKPVVPGMLATSFYPRTPAARGRRGVGCSPERGEGAGGEGPMEPNRQRTKNDAVPGRLRNPLCRVLGPFFVGGAASHLGGLALCGSGSASGFKVALPSGECKPAQSFYPHVPKKSTGRVCGLPAAGRIGVSKAAKSARWARVGASAHGR